MRFYDYVEIDATSKAINLKSFKDENSEIVIKLNNKDIKEIKLKQEFIEFFTSSEDYSNPLAPEFKIEIYLNNYSITYEVTGDNKEEVKKFCEYIKSILI